ncbi:peptidoglycan binding domain-containing protein [Caproiciproducens sp.]
MRHIDLKKLLKSGPAENIFISAASIALLYTLVSLYFCSHFFFNTEINGANVSLKAYGTADQAVRDYMKGYELQLTERNGETEKIAGHDIGLRYHEEVGISGIYPLQRPFQWISSLFEGKKYTINDLYLYNQDLLKKEIDQLSCSNRTAEEPKNVTFQYSNGFYEAVKEVYGNAILQDRLNKAVKTRIEKGEAKLNLEEEHCYKEPEYTLSSYKTHIVENLLNRYVSANITYRFDGKRETVNGDTIHKWITVSEDLGIAINQTAVKKYVIELSGKYDTVGAARSFKTSVGKTVAVKGGLYGWKIDRQAEAEALLENITRGEAVEKEPVYAQRALFRGEDEIGDTYLEINITKQHVWFYLDGKLLTNGSVVTGNPNRGWSTVTGVYMLNYKQEGAVLSGQGYEANVTYWMPFFGNTGLHDASWRYSFGGEIYKRNGTHGCINAPFYLAKTIFENIEVGTPIICYEEG